MGRPSREEVAARAANEAASEAGRVLREQRTDVVVEEASPVQDKFIKEMPKRGNPVREAVMEEIRESRGEGKPEATPEPEKTPEKTAEDKLPDATTQAVGIAAQVAASPSGDAPAVVAPVETVRVKVDGEEFDAPKADVEEAGGIRVYQREKAAEKRLKASNEALAETRRTQAAIMEFLQKQQTPAPVQPSKSELLQKVAQARYGTDDEFAAAIQQYTDQANPRVDQNAITQAAVNRMQQSNATQEFQKEFPDVVSNPLTLKLAVTLENERLAQMYQAGHTPNWSAFYKQLGNEVRSVMGRGTTSPPSPEPTTGTTSQVSSDKEARKASVVVALPTAGSRAVPTEEPKPETREESLNRMRKSRGLPIG